MPYFQITHAKVTFMFHYAWKLRSLSPIFQLSERVAFYQPKVRWHLSSDMSDVTYQMTCFQRCCISDNNVFVYFAYQLTTYSAVFTYQLTMIFCCCHISDDTFSTLLHICTFSFILHIGWQCILLLSHISWQCFFDVVVFQLSFFVVTHQLTMFFAAVT